MKIALVTGSAGLIGSQACNFFSASSALSALLSYQTATVAFITRIQIITNGSTNAANPESPVLLPGEVENTQRAKNKNSIEISTSIWQSIQELAEKVVKP